MNRRKPKPLAERAMDAYLVWEDCGGGDLMRLHAKFYRLANQYRRQSEKQKAKVKRGK
jgi:hypothetical protein